MRTTSLPGVVLGAGQWSKYYGEVGAEPPLPANIDEILTRPLYPWPDKRMGETHLLVLIPATVDGQPFSLDLLGTIDKEPESSWTPYTIQKLSHRTKGRIRKSVS